MAKYTGNILTNLGKDLLARAIAGGEVITFTKVELGKGITTGNKEELEALTDSFKVLTITSTAKLDGGAYRVRVAFDNTGITTDTELREIGVFTRGEDGVEILYSYCDTNTPDLIPAEGSGVLERVEDVITYVSNAANINAVIDQSNMYATIKDLNDGLAFKENKFDKNTGFNLNKTDSAETDSSILVATAKAVKKAWDKALEAIGFTDTNKNAIQNNTEQIENLLKGYELLNNGGFYEVGHEFTLSDDYNNYSRLIICAEFGGTPPSTNTGESTTVFVSRFEKNKRYAITSSGSQTERIIFEFLSDNKLKIYANEGDGTSTNNVITKVVGYKF